MEYLYMSARHEYGAPLPPAYEDALIVPNNQLGTLRDPTRIGRVSSAFDVRVDYDDIDDLRTEVVNSIVPTAERAVVEWDDMYDRVSVRSSVRLQQEQREDRRKFVVTGLIRHDAEPMEGWRLVLRLQSYQTKGPEEWTTDAQYDMETKAGRVIRAMKYAKVTRSFYRIDKRLVGGSGEVRHVRFHDFHRPVEPRHCAYIIDHLRFTRDALLARGAAS